MSQIDQRLAELGIVLPRPRRVPANFVPTVLVRDLLYVSGTLGTVVNASDEDVIPLPGKLGDAITLEQGYQSARQCAINHLAWIRAAIGNLDRVRQIVKLNGYVNAVEGYDKGPWVVNGASDLLVEVLANTSAGTHAPRSAWRPGLQRPGGNRNAGADPH